MAGLTPRIDAIEDPTQLSDEIATKLGLKIYEPGGSYFGGGAPTVTSNSGLTGFGVIRAVFIPYQMQDGSWRLRSNGVFSFSSVSISDETFSILGVVFKNIANYSQRAVFSYGSSTFVPEAGFVSPGTDDLRLVANAAVTVTSLGYSFDVELEAKPDWAY